MKTNTSRFTPHAPPVLHSTRCAGGRLTFHRLPVQVSQTQTRDMKTQQSMLGCPGRYNFTSSRNRVTQSVMNRVISSGMSFGLVCALAAYSLKRPLSPALLAILFAGFALAAEPANPPTASVPPPVTLTAQQDHQRLKDLLHISALRPGRNGNNPQATNYANYDESKANPYPNLPDPLVLKNGQKVTTQAMWWNQR